MGKEQKIVILLYDAASLALIAIAALLGATGRDGTTVAICGCFFLNDAHEHYLEWMREEGLPEDLVAAVEEEFRRDD